jgi:hypothetical protein
LFHKQKNDAEMAGNSGEVKRRILPGTVRMTRVDVSAVIQQNPHCPFVAICRSELDG